MLEDVDLERHMIAQTAAACWMTLEGLTALRQRVDQIFLDHNLGGDSDSTTDSDAESERDLRFRHLPVPPGSSPESSSQKTGKRSEPTHKHPYEDN